MDDIPALPKCLGAAPAPISVNVSQAARMTGVSDAAIWRAIRSNELIAHYPIAKAVILLDDLRAWVQLSTTDSPRAMQYRPSTARSRRRPA